MIQTSPSAKQSISRLLYVSGCPRSGTTVVGNLIGSASGVEYAYEPALLHTLLPLLDPMTRAGQSEAWKLLFETYCYEELLLGLLAGRSFNLNRHDDSYAGNYYMDEEIESRLSRGFRKHELDEIALGRRLTIKTPGVLPDLVRVAALYPTMQLVVVVRRPNDVLGSLLSRRWFDISPEARGIYLWPYREHRSVRIPHCISEELHDWWISPSTADVERAATYLLIQWKACRDARRVCYVDYDMLVSDPDTEVARLFGRLGIDAGKKTSAVASRLRPRSSAYPDFLAKLPPQLGGELIETAETMRREAGNREQET